MKSNCPGPAEAVGVDKDERIAALKSDMLDLPMLVR